MHTPLPSDTMISNESRIQDSCSPEGRVNYIDGSAFSVSKLFSSPRAVNGESVDNGNDFNISPPYRLWSKRKATSKPVEKQLDFSLKNTNFDVNTKFSLLEVNRNFYSPTNKHVSTMQEKKLKNSLGSKGFAV